ncbi:MAG: sensor histidine kinase [Chloroflexi bacterium]|nr:sensor histidine kinase [Chloroflexota bacterium]
MATTLNPVLQSPLFRRFWDIAGAVSVRVKVLGIVLGVILLLSLFITLQMRSALAATLDVELENQGLALVENLAEQAAQLLREGNQEALHLLLEERQAHYSSESHNTLVDYILIEDRQGQPIAHTFGSSIPDDVTLPAAPSQHGITHLKTRWGGVMDINHALPDRLGVLRLGLAEDNIERTVDAVTWQIATITLMMVVVGFIAAFFLTWILTRPLLTLVNATEAVARGDFTQQVPRWAKDEIGDLAEAFNAMTRALAQAERERADREALRENYIRGVIQAQEEERKRIARELHDSTSQSLTSLLVGLRNLEAVEDRETLECRINDIRGVVGHTLDEVHALAWQLRPSVLDDLGLVAALERYVADYQQRYGIPVHFITRGVDERLPVELETSIYRIIQEGLTNIARHSRATGASIIIERRKRDIRIIIEDNGIGFDVDRVQYSERSLGLQGIRERVQLFGGKLTVESQPGQGTSLFIVLPNTMTAEGMD